MSIDLGTPYLPEEEVPEGDRMERDRRLFLPGGAMGGISSMGVMGNVGGFTGPVYPMLLDLGEKKEEEDPNP